MSEAILHLVLSQEYTLPVETEGDDYRTWLEVTGGGPENSLRTLRNTELKLLGVQAEVEELCRAAESQSMCLLKAQFAEFWKRLDGLQAAVLGSCGDVVCAGGNLEGEKLTHGHQGRFRPVTPTPKGKLKEIIQSLQKASEKAAHRQIPPSDLLLQYTVEGLPRYASLQCSIDKGSPLLNLRSAAVSWNTSFEGSELLQWVNGVCGVPVEMAVGVCLGLLSAGVLENVDGNNREFALKAKYSWAGVLNGLGEAWLPSQMSLERSCDPINRLTYTEKEHGDVIQQVERQHVQATELMQNRHDEVMSGMRQSHSKEITKLEDYISDLRQQLSELQTKRGSAVEKKQSRLAEASLKNDVTQNTEQTPPPVSVPPPPPVSVPPPPPVSVPPLPPVSVPPPPPVSVPPPPPVSVPPPPPVSVPPPPPVSVPPPPPVSVHPPPPVSVPPPPPPPSINVVPTHAPRVEQYKPNIAIKALFWKRIKYNAVDIGQRDMVWRHIHEPELRDMKQFETLFAKKGNPSRSKKDPLVESFGGRSRAPKAVQLLDQKRSQAVGILMRSLHVEMSDIRNAVYNLDTSVLDLENLTALRDIQGTADEMEGIRSHLKNRPGIALDKPEMFLQSLSDIHQFDERVSSLLFQTSFTEELSTAQERVETIKALQTSPGVCEVLGIVLALGNVMNFGNRQRGQADGFDLTILGKLKEVRSNDNTGHLLQFIATYYVSHLDQHAGTVGAMFPLPDPVDLLAASQIKFDSVGTDLEHLRQELKACRSRVDQVIEHSPTDLLEPFQQRMNSFITKAETNLLACTKELETCITQFEGLVEYYCIYPQDNEDAVSPSHFFSLWFPFVRDFRDYWMKEQKAAAKKRQIAQQVNRLTNTALKPASKTGLKARLAKRSRKQC